MDDCWAAKDRVNGRMTHHQVRFKDGIASLASKIHAMGLKFGIYSDAGSQTCAQTMPGSLGHEDIDAETFANWGVDCNVVVIELADFPADFNRSEI
jgi:alpha-galactosidase